MTVGEIMIREVVTVSPDLSLEDLCEIFQLNHIHSAPVVEEDGRLIGVVTQEDIVYGAMGQSPAREERHIPSLMKGPASDERLATVGEIMTSPAIHVEEETTLDEACRLMWTVRIHRLPVVKDGIVSGVVSSMDVVRAVTEGRLKIA